jgi:uncharacterized RDD family membrane protein YckC
MTEQQGPPAQEPPAAGQPPPAPPPSGGGWQSPPPPAAPVPGTSGLVYADTVNRVFAYIIDAVILGIVFLIISAIVSSIFPSPTPTNLGELFRAMEVNYAAVVVNAVIQTALSAAYFIYLWMTQRGSLGQRMLGMQVGNAADGKSLTQEQAIRRWIFLGGPLGLISALSPVPTLGILLSLAILAYFIYLLVSTAQSPTKQGFHDVQANTVVVKAARSVA